MITRNTVKAASRILVWLGTGKIIGEVIAHNVDAPKSKIDKIQLVAGTYAIGGVVTGASIKYTDSVVDSVADAYDKFKAANQK
jgi:hypothetical protein